MRLSFFDTCTIPLQAWFLIIVMKLSIQFPEKGTEKYEKRTKIKCQTRHRNIEISFMPLILHSHSAAFLCKFCMRSFDFENDKTFWRMTIHFFLLFLYVGLMLYFLSYFVLYIFTSTLSQFYTLHLLGSHLRRESEEERGRLTMFQSEWLHEHSTSMSTE